MDRLLSQEEIDSVFKSLREAESDDDPARKAVAYDFRRPDRIAKHQLRAIHLLHENFARNLASSLSAYLRAYVVVNLVSVEQLSYSEFIQCLPSPTCIVSLGMKPYEGSAILEMNPSVVFPTLEILLGGNGKGTTKITREVTEIEQMVLDGVLRIVLHDLTLAWRGVTQIDFELETRETEPQLLQILSPNEAVLTIGLEVRIAENSGMMNVGIPSLIIKMLRQKFEQQRSARKAQSHPDEQSRTLRLISPASIQLDARLQGPTLNFEDLMALEPGNVLAFDYSVNRPLDLFISGKLKFRGQVADCGRKRVFLIEELHRSQEPA